MSCFFYAHEIARPEDVIPHLAKQERHWKKGYSAYELAHSWINAGGIPANVRSVLDTCPDYAGAQLVEGLFEREVDLRTRGHPSQTDLLAFVKLAHGNAVIAVEGTRRSTSSTATTCPYGATLVMFREADGPGVAETPEGKLGPILLIKPPYAHVVAIDLNAGEIACTVPFGGSCRFSVGSRARENHLTNCIGWWAVRDSNPGPAD